MSFFRVETSLTDSGRFSARIQERSCALMEVRGPFFSDQRSPHAAPDGSRRPTFGIGYGLFASMRLNAPADRLARRVSSR
jgi:hypothetical protein